jgi:hypothetical protein
MRVIPKQHRIEYQISVLNPLDRFDKPVARQLALDRLGECPFAVALPKFHNTHLISETVMRAIRDGSGLPTRARKSAKLWLRKNMASALTHSSTLEQMDIPYHFTTTIKNGLDTYHG